MFYSLISSHSFSKKALTRSPVTNGNSTLKKFFKRPFHHPSLAKRIIARRHGSVKPKEATWVLDKSFDSPRVSLGSTSSVMKFVVASALKFKKAHTSLESLKEVVCCFRLGYVKKVLEMSTNRAITTVVLSQHYR
ncbi:hypothetical protein Bca52824_043437 [Brassica carinata]|uniref:Uncharacterized protein n=1 Tax=Brassica carinata TaxID=52824 RepID=A0A8X7RWJ0_BRACI|nr:hypothetical protein Bca52824_043437 [Brassica carinata]